MEVNGSVITNLWYYRNAARLTIGDLALRAQMNTKELTNYERDKATPDMFTRRKLANALDVPLINLCEPLSDKLDIAFGTPLKGNDARNSMEKLICFETARYLSRLFRLASFFKGNVLPRARSGAVLRAPNADIARQNFNRLLDYPDGDEILTAVERIGYIVVPVKQNTRQGFARLGYVNGKHPFIAVSTAQSLRRQKFLILREVIKHLLKLPEGESTDYAADYIAWEIIADNINDDKPEQLLLEKLAWRAYAEERITMSRLADLLDISVQEACERCTKIYINDAKEK